ncbi:hypothetical protein BDZ89DRAFT_1112287 [Hymenopellis radicata]|nr:hypothetical protein BDZ89DRAFT_1112287 [Hymenopellis radicata]
MDDINGPFVLGSSSSAIARVPPEIWAEIFAFTRIIDVLRTLSHTPRQPPWNISYVCSLWRETAVSDSELWSFQPLYLDHECLRMKDPVSLLKLALARSSRPRAIGFFCGIAFPRNHAPPVVHALLQVLIDDSTSLARLLIRVHPSYADLLPQFRGRLPLLEDLEVDHDGNTPSIRGFEICPRLTSLSLGGAFETDSQFPWSQLNEFSDSRETAGNVPRDGEYYASIVAAAPNLQYFETICVPMTTPNVRIHHDTLTEIILCDVSLLSFFSFPSLERLAISIAPYDISTIPTTDPEEIGSDLATFVTQSHGCPHLTYLCVTNALPTATFEAVLAALPQLAELELPFCEWDEVTLSTTEGFLLNLTRYVETDDDGEVTHAYDLVPALASFRLVFSGGRGAPDVSGIVGGAFRLMLEERYGFSGQRSALKSVYLSVSGEVPREILNYYKRLKRLGLDIEVLDDPKSLARPLTSSLGIAVIPSHPGPQAPAVRAARGLPIWRSVYYLPGKYDASLHSTWSTPVSLRPDQAKRRWVMRRTDLGWRFRLREQNVRDGFRAPHHRSRQPDTKSLLDSGHKFEARGVIRPQASAIQVEDTTRRRESVVRSQMSLNSPTVV